MIEKETLGLRIKEQMILANRTQKQLAELIGVTESTMSRYINNERIPDALTLSNIATALNTTSDYLLGRPQNDSDLNSAITIVARNASQLSGAQKQELIAALFNSFDK